VADANSGKARPTAELVSPLCEVRIIVLHVDADAGRKDTGNQGNKGGDPSGNKDDLFGSAAGRMKDDEDTMYNEAVAVECQAAALTCVHLGCACCH
jgi:hypothetical protein